MKYLALGKRLKELREKRGITLEQLSAKLQLPKAELLTYESDQEIPRIGLLIKLARELGVNVADIFRDRPSKKAYELVRKSERQRVHPLFEPQEAKLKDYIYEPLTPPSDDKHLDAYMIEIPASQQRRTNPDLTHPGEEFVYVLEARFMAVVEGEEFELNTGDSLYLRSEHSHLFYNPFPETARALTVIYPF